MASYSLAYTLVLPAMLNIRKAKCTKLIGKTVFANLERPFLSENVKLRRFAAEAVFGVLCFVYMAVGINLSKCKRKCA